MTDNKQLVGQRIKTLRKAKKLTQDQLAEKVGMDSKHISKLETGAHYPSLDSLEVIATVLGVELRDFFEFPRQETEEEMRRFMIHLAREAPEVLLQDMVREIRRIIGQRGWPQ